VSVTDALVNMITLARQFDMHMKLLQNAEQNAAKAGQMLAVNG
jgi:flagellar basal-body rod protein FlgF